MWPMPITLDVTPEEAERIKAGDGSVALRDLKVRCVYIACCFSMFSAIERLAIASLRCRGVEVPPLS